MPRLAAPSLALLALLAVAPAASAGGRTVGPGGADMVTLAGDTVIYALPLGSPSTGFPRVDVRAVPARGGRARRLHRFEAVNSRTFASNVIGLDADGTRWAAVREAGELTGDGPDTDVVPQGSDLAAGKLGGRTSVLASTFGRRGERCSRFSFDRPADVAVIDRGYAVAVESSSCTREGVIIRVGDRSRRLAGTAPVRGAKRYVAYQRGTSQVVVYDARRAREAYRVSGRPGERVESFDLQTDGKLAVQWRTDEDAGRLSWYSIPDPRAHDLTVRSAELPGQGFPDGHVLQMAGDRIVLPLEESTQRFSIVAFSLDDERRTVERAGGDERPLALDFDGRRTAWVERRAGVRVATVPLAR